MSLAPQHDGTDREQGIRGGGHGGPLHIQETSRQPVEQPDASEIDHQQTEADSRVGLPEHGQNHGVSRINPRELHVVEQLVRGNSLQD